MDTPKQKALHVISHLSEGCSWDDILDRLQTEKIAHKRQTNNIDWDGFVRQVRTVLYDQFPEAKGLKLEVNEEGQKISGFIISKDFDGMEDADRQDRLWDVFEEKLSPEEQSRILSVIALTPEESVAQGVA